MIRAVILGSGRGSNAKALLEAHGNGDLGLAEIVGIFSDQPHAGILQLGPRYDISAFYLNPGTYRTKFTAEVEQHWVETISALVPDLIILAGFMRVLKAPFLEAFPRIINLHPSLLPKYPGLHSIRRALDAEDAETGCTVHWVSAEVDAGDIIDQMRVPIHEDDALETLTERVHDAEHQLLPAVVKKVARDLYINEISN